MWIEVAPGKEIIRIYINNANEVDKIKNTVTLRKQGEKWVYNDGVYYKYGLLYELKPINTGKKKLYILSINEYVLDNHVGRILIIKFETWGEVEEIIENIWWCYLSDTSIREEVCPKEVSDELNQKLRIYNVVNLRVVYEGMRDIVEKIMRIAIKFRI